MKDYIQKIIRIFTTSEPQEEVTGEVHRWLLSPEHADEKEKALHSLWDTTEEVADVKTRNSLLSVYKKVGADQKTVVRQSFRIWQYAAAVVLLTVSVSATYYYTKQTYSEVAMIEKFTPYGSLNSIVLPDGSTVQTNSGTILFYPESFKGDTRTIYLMGEANFKVKKNPDQPFIVKSGLVSVRALGTEFNVSAYPKDNQIVATLITGKVKVDWGEGEKNDILTPGQQMKYEKSTMTGGVEQANLSDVTAWQRGAFVFRGSTIREMLTVLERRYNITFQCDVNYFNKDKYNFEFPEKSNIQEIMDIVQVVVGDFDYELGDGYCYIKTKKNN